MIPIDISVNNILEKEWDLKDVQLFSGLNWLHEKYKFLYENSDPLKEQVAILPKL